MSVIPVTRMQVGFETEGTAIYDTMRFVRNEVSAPSAAKRLPVQCGLSLCMIVVTWHQLPWRS